MQVTTFTEFSGFTENSITFLQQLSENNDKEWFDLHKNVYLENIQKPALAFISELGERLKTISLGIEYDTRTNGSGSLMRIYRDIRFSKDKRPYHTRIRMVFWEGAGKRTDNPGFFLVFGPTGITVYSGMHMFSKPVLETFRNAVMDDHLGPELQKAIESVQNSGDYVVGGEQYKRIPTGFDPNHPRAYLLLFKGLHAISPKVNPHSLFKPELVDLCFEHCKNMGPLHKWLVKLNELAHSD
jgi:uncharacterized protein (TIGR02453 family)